MKLALYELASDYADVLESASDAIDADEIKAWQDTLEGIKGSIDDKAENMAKLCRCLTATAAAVKAEEERLAKKRKAIESRVEDIKKYGGACLISAGLRKAGGVHGLAIQANSPSVIIDDEAAIPEEFRTIVTTVKIEKKPIMEAIKAGLNVPGAHVEQGESVRVK